MLGLFRRKQTSDDAWKKLFVKNVSGMLALQQSVSAMFAGQQPQAGYPPIEDSEGRINRRAIGYIYGFVDAALRVNGQDMSDPAIGPSITCQVLRRLFPGLEEKYTRFLIDHIATDDAVMLGILKGGQQYVEFASSKGKTSLMGLANYMIEGDRGE